MATRLESIIDDVNNAVKKLQTNDLVEKARASIKKELGSYTLTDDQRADKLINFEIQLALGMLERTFAVAADSDIKAEQLKAAQFEKLAGLAKLKKEYGYGNATEEALGSSTDDGMIDKQKDLVEKQIEGFYKDQVYKVQKSISETIGMLAMNDVETPEWMSDIFRIAIEIVSDGKIDIQKTANPNYTPPADEEEPKYITTVQYNGQATGPNGI